VIPGTEDSFHDIQQYCWIMRTGAKFTEKMRPHLLSLYWGHMRLFRSLLVFPFFLLDSAACSCSQAAVAGNAPGYGPGSSSLPTPVLTFAPIATQIYGSAPIHRECNIGFDGSDNVCGGERAGDGLR